MGRLTLASLLTLLTITANADETLILKARDGSASVLTLHADGRTTTVVVPSSRIIQTDAPPTPTPNPDTPTPSAGLDDVIRRALASVTDDNKAENARKIASIYRVISQQAAAGTFRNTSEIAPSVKRLTDMILERDAEKWAEFRRILGAELTRLGQAGQLSNTTQITATFGQIADILDKQTAGQLSAEAEKGIASILGLILKLLPIILELIRGFS